ncbi:ectodysplasin-A receptor-associated adapter protein [Platysternon megacephalum]|uniref:Ectodysplasin-A receptor-associated adapter protein n=1 Tax=Platysternon megacephalum TaxID=55544 RepID=A0A4D9EP71_9SAUR|nr:ectodysplasin-A receptor-associated adapter protein [Platysternon megacephalum]
MNASGTAETELRTRRISLSEKLDMESSPGACACHTGGGAVDYEGPIRHVEVSGLSLQKTA